MVLSNLGEKYGTDKGTVHSYLDIYEDYFNPLRDEEISLLEIGICNGNSIRMWLDYFPLAHITGLDESLANCKKVEHERFDFCHMKQANENDIRNSFLSDQFDIIIDDGSHEPNDQILSFHYLWRCLKSGGLYFIEDVRDEWVLEYWKGMPGVTVFNNQKNGRLDDILILVRKK